MSVKAPVAPRFKYTVEEIDSELAKISELLRFSDEKTKKIYIRKANQWLDKRNEYSISDV